MGWSCRADAGNTMQKIEDCCRKQTGSQNSFRRNGNEYFIELSYVEHDDGAITGSIMLVTGDFCNKSGSLRIEGDGTITRPKYLREMIECTSA